LAKTRFRRLEIDSRFSYFWVFPKSQLRVFRVSEGQKTCFSGFDDFGGEKSRNFEVFRGWKKERKKGQKSDEKVIKIWTKFGTFFGTKNGVEKVTKKWSKNHQILSKFLHFFGAFFIIKIFASFL
jgi:hypothetical protein